MSDVPYMNAERPYEKGANVLTQPATTYCIPGALEELDMAIGRLDEELGMIYSKLDVLLQPEQASPGHGPEDTYPPMSGVALRIYRMADKTNQMKNTLRDLRERIDL